MLISNSPTLGLINMNLQVQKEDEADQTNRRSKASETFTCFIDFDFLAGES